MLPRARARPFAARRAIELAAVVLAAPVRLDDDRTGGVSAV